MAKTFSFEEALQPVSQQTSTFSFEEAMKPVAKQPTTFSFEEAIKPSSTKLQGEQDEFTQAKIESAKQQEVAAKQPQKPEEKAKEEKHWYDFLNDQAKAQQGVSKQLGEDLRENLSKNKLLEDLYVAGKNSPSAAKAAFAAVLEGNDPNVVFGEKDWKDSVIEDARKRAKEVRAMPGGEEEYMLGITREKVRNLPQNFFFSIVSMGAGLAAGVPAAFATTPTGGFAIGGAASGVAAYRMDTNGFLRDLREHLDDAAEKTTGKPLTDEQFIKVAKNYESLIQEHGYWEALPEALGNVVGAKIGGQLFKAAAPGIKGLISTFYKAGQGLLVEEATETITQTGQHNVEVDTGMSKEPKRSFTSYEDLKKSAEEVLPDVLLLSGVTQGGAKAAGAVYRTTDYAKNREIAQAMQEDIAGRGFTQEGIQREAANRMAGVKPTEMSDIAKSIEDRDAGIAPPVAPPVAPQEPPEEAAQAQPTIFSEDNLLAMGIGKTNKKLREALVGKDLSNPDERAEVQTALQEYRDRPKLSEGIRTKVDDFLNSPVMTSEISAVTSEAVDQTLTTPKVEAVQVDSLEGDPSEVEMDVGKAYAAGKSIPVASPLGELRVVALEDPNDNGELFIHDDMGEVVGSVFFTKDEAPDGTRFEPVFTIDNSYRDKDFDAAIYDLMHSLGAVTPKQEEIVTAEPTKIQSTLKPETIDEILAQDKDDLLLRSFVDSLHQISQAEKDSDPSTWTQEETDAYQSGDYEKFSRLRGYTEEEIKAYKRYQKLTQQVDKKYEDPFASGESISFGIVKAYDDVVGQDTTGAKQTTAGLNLNQVAASEQRNLTKYLEGFPLDEKRYSAYINDKEIGPLLKATNDAIQKLTDFINGRGFSFREINRATPDQEVQRAKDLSSEIAGMAVRLLSKQDAVDRSLKRGNADQANKAKEELKDFIDTEVKDFLKESTKSAKAAKALPKNIFIPPVPDNQRDGQEATTALEPEELVAPRQTQRLPSLKRQIEQVNRAFQEGRITAEEHAAQTRDTLELHNLRLSRQPIRPRSRGADFIRQKLLEAKRRGEISERAADLAEWFILQNPELVSGLGISIRQARRGETNTSGVYSSFERVVTLIKNTNADATTVHEIFHHLERMMPREVQDAIRTAWRQNFTRARRQAERGDYDSLSSTLGKNLQTFFELLNDYHFGTAKADTWTRAIEMLTDGRIPIEFYQYVDPSEFWAVNSTNIMQNRYDFSNSVMDRLRNWMREFKETIKNIFGIPSKAPLIRAIDSLLRGDGRFRSAFMLAEESMFRPGEYASINQPQRTPTPQAQATLDELNKHGLGVRPDPLSFTEKMSAIAKNAKDNPAATLKSSKETYIRFSDFLGTKIFSSDRALNNNIRRAVVEAGLGQEEILGYLLNMSLSQTNHSDAVGVNHLIYGDTKWNEDVLKWEAKPDDGAKLSTLAKLTEDMAKKHGWTYEEAENVAHRAFEVRRIQGLQKLNEELRDQMRDNYAQGNIKEANRLRRKLKYIHLDQDQIDAASDLFNKYPELEKIDKVWNKQRENTAKVLVDTGLWTPEEAKELLSYTDYVPFYREKEEETENNPKGMLRGLQVQAKERRLKGSDLAVVNVYDNMAQWAQFAINRAVRNRSNIALIDGLTEFAMAEKVSGPDKAKNVVKVWRDGKLEYYSVSDPMFLPAFQGLESLVLPMLKQAATFTNVLRDSVVMFPLFTLAQVPADSYTAMFTSGLKPKYALRIPFIAVKEFVTTLAGRSKSHEELKKFAAVGVKDFMGSSALREAKLEAGIMKNAGISRKILEYAKSGLKTFAMAGDNSVRQAVYLAAKQAKLSEAEAIEKAFNVIHFRNKGSSKTIRVIGQTVPFFTAYLAAMDVTIKTVTGVGISPQDRKEAFKTLLYTSTAVSILSLLYTIANADDEDYLKKPTQVRDRLLMIPGTGGLSIPLRKDLFLFPKIIAEHVYLLLTKKGFEDPKKFWSSMKTWLISSVSSPNLVGQYIKPIVEVGINYDFFMDRDLVPYYQEKMETSRKFNDATSELGKLVGKTGAVSPIGFDHLIKGYFGSVGGIFLNVTSRVLHSDPEVSRPEMSFRELLNTVPSTSGFISKANENSLKTDFYELQAECNKAALTLKDLENRSPQDIKEALKDKGFVMKAGMAPEINAIGKELGEIRKYITFVSNAPDSKFSPEKKTEEIKRMRDLEWEVMKKLDVRRLRALANP
jgi:hypothetical protein